MIKKHVFLFWTYLLIVSGFSQTNKIFKSIEEAKQAPIDSVINLDLSGQRLKQIPVEILQFKKLQHLNLAKNKLTDLPESFHFNELRTLNLEKNKFTVFPDEICKLTELKQLFLGRNEIAKIPACIGDLSELIVLDVWLNVLVDLPDELMLLKKLEHLDLRGMNFNDKFQGAWNNRLSWVQIEFDKSCDCAH